MSAFVVISCQHRVRVLFGPKREEVTGDWRILHNGELHDVQHHILSGDQIKESKCARHTACLGEKRNAQRVWWTNLKEADHLQDLGLDVRITLRWILGKQAGSAWTGLIWPRM